MNLHDRARNPLIEATEQLSVYERDARLISDVQAGELARLSLQNDWENLLPRERADTSTTVANGEQARTEILGLYQELPGTIVERMQDKQRLPHSAPSEDMVQAAWLGLLEAMHTWDYASEMAGRQGFRTYASLQIAKKVLETYGNCAVVTSGLRPSHFEDLARIQAATENGVTIEEIADKIMGEEVSIATTECRHDQPIRLSPDRYVALMAGFVRPESYVGHGDDLEPLVPSALTFNGRAIDRDAHPSAVETAVMAKFLRPAILRALEDYSVDPRGAEILRLRFGFEDGHMQTLEEVAKRFNLTREKTRQIEARTMSRLRRQDVVLFRSDSMIDQEFAQEDLEAEAGEVKPQVVRVMEKTKGLVSEMLLEGVKPDELSEILRRLDWLSRQHGMDAGVLSKMIIDDSAPKFWGTIEFNGRELRSLNDIIQSVANNIAFSSISFYGFGSPRRKLDGAAGGLTLTRAIKQEIAKGTPMSVIQNRLDGQINPFLSK